MHTAPSRLFVVALSIFLAVSISLQGSSPVLAAQQEEMDIDTIILFRREFETRDCVCMSLEGEGEVLGEINEEMTGWNDVVTALPAQFEGVMPANQWQDAVRRPHRRPRATVIYDGRRSLDD